jgi:hypothetical protein
MAFILPNNIMKTAPDNVDVIDFIIENQDTMVSWVHEFFEGKYTEQQVRDYLYHIDTARNAPRMGVEVLANEFTNLEEKTTESIKQWYSDTDFYIFDLLPWNASNMFRAKVLEVKNLIDTQGLKSIVDFGGGIGMNAIYLSKNTDCKIYYVDLPNSVTSRFAKFLMNKFGVTNVEMMTDEEFFSSNLFVDAVVAMDCFEHIPNMEETFDNIIEHTHVVFHQSTFHADKWSPQHVYTPNMLDFINMCALRNYLPRGNPELLWRSYIQFDNQGNLKVNFV